MGLRTSLRLGRKPDNNKKQQLRTESLSATALENNSVESPEAEEERISRPQSLAASLPCSPSVDVDMSKTRRRRRSRFSSRRSNKDGDSSEQHPNDDGLAPPKGVEKTDPMNPADNIQKTTTSTKRPNSGFNLLRRLSSPIGLLRFNSSNGAGGGGVDRENNSSGGSKDTSEESHGFDSDENNPLSTPIVRRTTVVPETYSPPRRQLEQLVSPVMEDLRQDDKLDQQLQQRHKFECATAILQHSYLERMCGGGRQHSFDDSNDHGEEGVGKKSRRNHYTLPEDPTVQESIECIFASQLESGLELWGDVEEEERSGSGSSDSLERFSSKTESDLISPADLQQSRMNRKDRKNSKDLSMNQIRKRYEQASLVYVGTYDPNVVDQNEVVGENNMVKTSGGHVMEALPCPCHSSAAPLLKPEDWPQYPILLRPTPGSSTRVKAIRFCDSKNPLWVPGSHLNWSQRLAQHWGRDCAEEAHHPCCEYCAICPVNNGNEAQGESLVIDFESELFEGTLLLRLRFIEGTTPDPYDDSKGYFKGVNRRYQTVVHGRFKKPLPLTHMVNGYKCNRRFGKLPAKWILKGGMKVLSFFAPQLDAKLDGDQPYSLTPLCSTAQSVAVDTPETVPPTIEDGLHEPKEAHRTLIGQSSDAPTSLQRAKLRKKVFDKFFVAKSNEPMADPSKIYTFEFLQHLFNFESFSIELGNMLGSVELEEILDGQPLQIMAAFEDQPLWSFDVWHECLWNRAREIEGK